ncbi:MAG: CCA tRNA nucleotidyltransferase [Alphaproteobacteria bacterium]|nr:CCA tRNA nucleotidyltransferase [Alphaproteobacteria bacterium]
MFKDKYLDMEKIITDKAVLRLFDVVEKHGGVLRFVGGAVRDALAGRQGFDLDLATDMSPDELVETCEENNIKTIPIGIKYGTVGVVINDKVLEITSLRKDIKTDGRHAEVEFTTDWQEDASRRDLTINAVYADEKGNVFDYYNGIDDLEKGVVRFIGNPAHRIQEDYLRILRFFRFYSIFGKGEIDAKALAACRNNQAGLKKISIERVRDELAKIMVTPNVIKTMKIIIDNDILGYILPKAPHFTCLERLITLVRKESLDESALRRLFILYLPNEKLAESFANRLKLSKKQKELFVSWARYNPSLNTFMDKISLQKLLYEQGREFCYHRFILKCAETGIVPREFHEVLDNIASLPIAVFPLKGRDLIKAGVEDNRKIGQILKMLEHLWIESGFVLSKDELLAQVHHDLKEIL